MKQLVQLKYVDTVPREAIKGIVQYLNEESKIKNDYFFIATVNDDIDMKSINTQVVNSTRDIALKPIHTCGGHGYEDDDDEDFWCPICKCQIGNHYGFPKYCPECGQHILEDYNKEYTYEEMRNLK